MKPSYKRRATESRRAHLQIGSLTALHLALPPCGLSWTSFLIALHGFISFLTAAKYSIQWMYHQVLQWVTDPSYQELSL